MFNYFWGNGNQGAPTAPAATPSRPVATFDGLYKAIDVIAELKNKMLPKALPHAGEQSTKIAILQAMMSKEGHEEIAEKTTDEDIKEILKSLSDSELAELIANSTEVNYEQNEQEYQRRTLIRQLLGIMFTYDEDIIPLLFKCNPHVADIQNGNILKEGDTLDVITLLEATEEPSLKRDAAIKAIKAYIISANTLLDEIRFGLLDKLDFIFPHEVQLVPSPTALVEQAPQAALPPAPPVPPPPPTPQARAARSIRESVRSNTSAGADYTALALNNLDKQALILEAIRNFTGLRPTQPVARQPVSTNAPLVAELTRRAQERAARVPAAPERDPGDAPGKR